MRYKFFHDEEGSIIVITALLTTVLIGFCAFVIDLGRVAIEKEQLQNAVDAACLAAARDLPDTIKASDTANRYITLNGFEPSDISIDFSDANRTVSISSSKEVVYLFAGIFGQKSARVHPSASATSQGAGAAFDYTLFSGSTSHTLAINGSSLYIGGNAHSNYKFTINGSSQTITGACEAVSTLKINGSNIHIGSQVPNASVVDMPDFSDQMKSQAEEAGQAYMGNKTYNVSQLSIDSPIFVDGNVTINGSHFSGKGCIVATGNITFNGSNQNNSSDDAVCFYSKYGDITLNGSNAVLDGILYAPHGSITMNGSNQTVNGRVVGNTINMNGSNIEIIGGTGELLSLPFHSVKLKE